MRSNLYSGNERGCIWFERLLLHVPSALHIPQSLHQTTGGTREGERKPSDLVRGFDGGKLHYSEPPHQQILGLLRLYDDHFAIERAIYRWWLLLLNEHEPWNSQFCCRLWMLNFFNLKVAKNKQIFQVKTIQSNQQNTEHHLLLPKSHPNLAICHITSVR